VGEFRQRALITASRWIARLLLIALLVSCGLSVTGAILGSIGASLVELGICRRYIRPSLFHRSAFPTRQMWDYAVPLFLFALTMRFFDKLDLFALKVLGGTAEQAGIYGAAQNLSLGPSIFALAFSPILLSTLSRMLREGNHALAKQTGRKAMRGVVLMLPLAGMTAGAAVEIVSLIYGPVFSPAAPLLACLIFGAVALVMISVATAILTAAGKAVWTFALAGPLPFLAIIGHLLLIPRLGAIGASLVTACSSSLVALAAVAAVYRLWRVLPTFATLWRGLLVCMLAYLAAALWHVPGFWLCLKLPLISLGILLSFLVLGEFDAAEVALLRSYLRWPAKAIRARSSVRSSVPTVVKHNVDEV
jgi:O-antigen/teichoic acid export membrane protein